MKLLGCNPNQVLDLLENRKIKNYKAGSKSDGNNIGLIVEGGGMRGIISCAMLDVINRLGYSNCIDGIYGNSAGAINGSYFITNQSHIGTSIYFEDLSNKNFIDIFRWPNPMNLDFLINILNNDPLKKIDEEKLWSKNQQLIIATTNVENGEPICFKKIDIKNKMRLMSILKASASTPLFTNNREKIDNMFLNDGLVQEGIPLNLAINDGVTHILATLTRPSDYRKKNSKYIQMFEHLIIRKYNQLYQEKYYNRSKSYNQALEFLYQKSINIPTMVLTTDTLNISISNGEINRNKLEQAAIESMISTYNSFNVFGNVDTSLFNRKSTC